MQNLHHNIYPEATSYLTEERGLTIETLKRFKVGVGSDRFRCEETGNLKLYDAVYFPLFREMKRKRGASKTENSENSMFTEFCEPVRYKVRATGKEHKSKQRFTPNSSIA